MCLQPCFQQSGLQEPRVSLRAHFSFWILQHLFDKFGAVETAVQGRSRGQDFTDKGEERTTEITQRGYGEIPLRAVDHLCRYIASRHLLQNEFTAAADLEASRNARSQFHHFVIEEWDSCFEAKCHCHVVDPLDRIVHQHDL